MAFETFDIVNAPTDAQINRQLRGLQGIGKRADIGSVSAGTLLDLDIVWRGTRDFSDLELEDAAYLVYAGKRLANEIRERTIAGRLPSGRRTAALSPRYIKYKTGKGGRRIRDGVVTGSMWRGFGITRKKGKTAITIGFSGAHRPSGKVEYKPTRGKYKGQTRTKNVTNQYVANSWALRGRSGVPYSLSSFNGRPAHVFTETDDIQELWIAREYEMRVLHKGIDELPPIKGMGERSVGRGQKRRWQGITPRSA
jgi:hypothetical protein